MKIVSNGSEVELVLRGKAGPDGNPIGTIISYMGSSAPEDYLICDGAVYNINSYPNLAQFFQDQLGSKNYFGGNGTTTFAVPDMRNLFLRGYHGEATEQLSGNIGQKQAATEIPWVQGGISVLSVVKQTNNTAYCTPLNADSQTGATGRFYNSAYTANTEPDHLDHYTARPVNMAVLYCIKAIAAISGTSDVTMDQVEEAINASVGDIGAILDSINGEVV